MITRKSFRMLSGAMLLSTLVMLNAPSIAIAQTLPQPKAPNPFINILTGGTGGVFYPLGGALSSIFAAKIPGTRPSVQATKGSVENLNLLQQGKGEIAFTQGDSLAFAWVGDADTGFKGKHDKLRGIAAIYPSYIQIVATKESGIKTIADLKGKRLSVGAQRSGTEVNTRALLKAAGMSYKDFAKIEYLPFAESVDLMIYRKLDATLQTAGLGVPALRDLASTNGITVVAVPAGIVDKVGAPYQKVVIPKGTYKGQDADVQTAGLPNYLVTRADVSAELIYHMTKAVFESTAELTKAHSAAAGISLKRALDGMPVPLHPGAAKYFKEKGLVK
jgi:TRAP transporter TAXI family solute receptor